LARKHASGSTGAQAASFAAVIAAAARGKASRTLTRAGHAGLPSPAAGARAPAKARAGARPPSGVTVAE
jgi:hypothetical protein